MKRGGPLERRTPLTARTPMRRGHGLANKAPRQGDPIVGAPAPGIDLKAAADALTRQRQAPPREFTGPVPDVSTRAPKPASTGFPPAVRQTILDRDHMRCQAFGCGRPVDTCPVGYSLQHRDNRGMGGTSDPRVNHASNGLTLCGSGTTGCHGRVEADPVTAERHGYAVASWADPETVPVLTYDGRWVLLSANGTAWPTTPPPGGDAHAVARRKAPAR